LNREVLLQLIDKYLAGETSAEEQQLLHNYFDSFQQSTDWNELELGSRHIMEQQLLQQLQQGLQTSTASRKTYVYRLGNKWLVAAGILAFLLCSYLLWALLYKWNSTIATLEVVTGLQERKQVKLADGTAIWLEPGSRLNYPKAFNDSIRQVTISGEAFFEVAKNPHQPFVIHTGAIRTRVLGTSFAVKAYDTAIQEVAVVTGRVMVQVNEQSNTDAQVITIVANQKASWNNRHHRLEKIELPSTLYYAQRRYGKFIYQGETVAAVIDDIAHQYNVQVQFDAAIGTCTFYGGFDIKQPVGKVLNTLAAALNTQLIKDNAQDTYRLPGGGCFSTKL
jgi:transmembrane sensor